MNGNRPEGNRPPGNRPGGGPPGPLGGGGRFNMGRIVIILLVIAGIFLLPWLIGVIGGGGTSTQVSYSSFRNQLQQGNVQSVVVKGDQITGAFKNPGEVPNPGGQGEMSKNFVTYVPSFGDPELLGLLESKGVTLKTQPAGGNNFLEILLYFLPFLFLIWIFFAFFRRMGSQGRNLFQVGQNRAKLFKRSKESITFDDVAGIESAKFELHEVVDFLQDPGRYRRIGAKSPKGVLLVGPPGTGKTLLARAVAGEADVPFYSITGSDFMEMFVGVGASRVRNLFKDAKKNSPSIIFIDELDSIGRHRGAGLGGGHDEREQTLNQLLSELDGFEPQESTIVIAATNRPDILDPALLRPGRFDRRVTVDLPTLKDREEILRIHAKGKPLTEDVDFHDLAAATPGFSGADLANLLNEAALLAARKRKPSVNQGDIEEARDKLTLGLERKNLTLTEQDKQVLAYHEGGHAVLAVLMPNSDPLHKVTIIPRDRAMGVTQQLPERDKYIYEKEYLMDRIAVMMGGRAAERLKRGASVTTGAENDLKQATRIARKMVLDWGMSEKLEHMALGSQRQHVFLGEDIGQPREYSEATAQLVDQEVRSILRDAFQRALHTLEENEEALDKVASELIEKEVLDGQEVVSLVRGGEAGGGEAGKEADKRSASKH